MNAFWMYCVVVFAFDRLAVFVYAFVLYLTSLLWWDFRASLAQYLQFSLSLLLVYVFSLFSSSSSFIFLVSTSSAASVCYYMPCEFFVSNHFFSISFSFLAVVRSVHAWIWCSELERNSVLLRINIVPLRYVRDKTNNQKMKMNIIYRANWNIKIRII